MEKQGLPPGPPLPSAAQAYLWAYRYPEFTAWAHRRYGRTYTARVGGLPPSVVTTDREVIRRLFTGDPQKKRHANDILRGALGDRSLLLLEPAEHLARRKLLSPPFHGERVRGYARLMERLVAAELDGWHDGGELKVIKVAQRLTLDVILEAVLGLSDATLRDRLRAVFDAMLDLPGTEMALYYPAVHHRSRWNKPLELYWRKRDVLDQMLNEQIAATRADPELERRADILALMIQARDESGQGLTDTDLRHELNTLISAGHETTATAIAWGAELLAHNPEVQAQARDAVGAADQRYLDALVKEILRIRAPVAVAAARHPLEPFEIGEYVIGSDAVILADCWAVHLDPSVFPAPESFWPTRFLEPTPEYSFLPFGGGAHRCLGAALAQLEMKVVLSAMLERFQLTPVNATLAPAVRRGIVLAPKGGGHVRVGALPAPRQPAAPGTPVSV